MANKYVDFGATNDGDGTAYNQAASPGAVGAFKTLAGKTFSNGDIVWIRRSASALALAAALTPSMAGVSFVGWPISGDDLYASRPAAAQATWDADSAQYAKITTGTATFNFAPTGTGAKFYRLLVDSSLTSGGTTPVGVFAGASNYMQNCQFTYSGAVNGTSADLRCLSITGTLFNGNGIYCKGASAGATTGSAIVNFTVPTADGYIRNLTIDVAYANRGTYSNQTAGALVCGSGSTYKPVVVEGLTINFNGALNAHQGSAILNSSTQGGPCYIMDATINAQGGNAYEGPGVYIYMGSRVTNMKGTGNNGCIYAVSNYSFVEAKNWNILYPMTNGTPSGYSTGGVTCPVVCGPSTTVMLTNATLTTSSGAVPKLSIADNSVALLNYTDFISGSVYKNTTNLGADWDVFSMNHAKSAGAWHYENRHGTLDTSNTYRSGGSNFSIKGAITESDFGQNRRMMQLSTKGRESIMINLAAGTNTVTVYGAYKNWAGTNEAAPTQRDFGLMFDWFDINGAAQNVSTFQDAALTADGSTWNNDPGLTGFKVAVTISNAQAQTVPLNIVAGGEYDATGYWYIDPAPVVT